MSDRLLVLHEIVDADERQRITKQCIQLLNSQWPRSETLREKSLKQVGFSKLFFCVVMVFCFSNFWLSHITYIVFENISCWLRFARFKWTSDWLLQTKYCEIDWNNTRKISNSISFIRKWFVFFRITLFI